MLPSERENDMIERETAIKIQKHALRAIEELNSALISLPNNCSAEDFQAIRRGVGLSLGTIQMELLEVINQQYPELDDLKD